MPSQSADLLRHERNVAHASAIAQQFNKTSTVGFIVRSYGSSVDVTTDGTNRIRVAYLGGSIKVGDPVNVNLRGYKGTKGFEAL